MVRMSSVSGSGSEAQLLFKLKGLEHDVAESAARVRRRGWLAVMLFVLLLVLLVTLYLYNVMQYALIRSVSAVPSDTQPGAATITYAPSSAGKVEFVRKTQELVETLTDFASDPITPEASQKHFDWSGAQNDEYDLQVTHRDGLSLVTKPLLSSGKPPKH
jgi:hypothetical protein